MRIIYSSAQRALTKHLFSRTKILRKARFFLIDSACPDNFSTVMLSKFARLRQEFFQTVYIRALLLRERRFSMRVAEENISIVDSSFDKAGCLDQANAVLHLRSLITRTLVFNNYEQRRSSEYRLAFHSQNRTAAFGSFATEFHGAS